MMGVYSGLIVFYFAGCFGPKKPAGNAFEKGSKLQLALFV